MPAPDLQFLTTLKPEDAVAYLRSKGYRISWNWRDTWQEAHAKAFTVAKAMKLDILNDIRESVTSAIDEGQTLEQFRQRLEPTLKSKGWWGKVRAQDVPGYDPEKSPPDTIVQLGSPYRLKTIYRTNLQTAYMAGKYKRYIDNADDRPYWRFIAVQDSRTRRSHAELHNKVFRYDDPFWDTHYPPLDWNCRCTVQALSADEVKEQNLHIETRAEAEELAAEIQPGEGWNYNVGKAAYVNDLLMWEKVNRLETNDSVKVSILRELMKSEPRIKAFDGFIDRVVESRKVGGETFTAGFLEPDIIKELQNRDIELSTGVVTISDKSVIHSIRHQHVKKDSDPTVEDLKNLINIIQSPESVFIDNRDNKIIYTFPSSRIDSVKNELKTVVHINYYLKKTGATNFIITIQRLPKETFKDEKTYYKIK